MATPPDFTAGQVLTAAQMNAIGLWKVSASTFSAAASHSVNNCFTSDFDAYRVIAHFSSSTSLTTTMRLRVGGVDNSGASSYGITILKAFNSTTDSSTSNTSSFGFSGTAQGAITALSFDIWQPAVAVNTVINGLTTQGMIAENAKTSTFWGRHDVNTAFDGFTLIASTGNITGYVKVYGYRN